MNAVNSLDTYVEPTSSTSRSSSISSSENNHTTDVTSSENLGVSLPLPILPIFVVFVLLPILRRPLNNQK